LLSDDVRGLQAKPFRMKLQNKSGASVSILATVTRQQDESGNEVILVLAQHIENSATEADAEEMAALETQMADLRALIDKANVPIWAVDLQGDINEWNYKIASLTQYSKVRPALLFNRPLGSPFGYDAPRSSWSQGNVACSFASQPCRFLEKIETLE
jgi:PAS domain-containing protein